MAVDYYSQQMMGQMGQPPVSGAPAGGMGERADRVQPTMLGLWGWSVARGYTGFTGPVSRNVAWKSRSFARGNSAWYSTTAKNMHPDFWKNRVGTAGGRPNGRFGMQWFGRATEANVLSRAVNAPFGFGWLNGTSKVPLLGSLGRTLRKGGYDMTNRGFIYRGIWEQGLAHLNLSAQLAGNTATYSHQQLLSMGQRMYRSSHIRGFKRISRLLEPEKLSVMGDEQLLKTVFAASNKHLPRGMAKVLSAMGKNRGFALAGRAAGIALPIANVYFTAKLVGDVAEWSTKKVLRGLNWMYFKVPMQLYNTGTASLRAPVLGSGTYVDTPGAQTQRQRAIQAIQNSRINARSAVGAEASLMHNYFG